MPKAVIFDLFETLVTEWGHEKYTKRMMCADLGVSADDFSPLWEELHDRQYRGEITFADSLRYVCGKLGVPLGDDTLAYVTRRRISTKSACFDCLHDGIIPMLKRLRSCGYKLAILSNCSEEEVRTICESSLAPLFDAIVLSYETGLCKPDTAIYELTAQRLGVDVRDCVFIGDGGSNELYGAVKSGMRAYRAMWYIRELPHEIKPMPEFDVFDWPDDVIIK